MMHVSSTGVWRGPRAWAAALIGAAALPAWGQSPGLLLDESAVLGPRLQTRIGLNTSLGSNDGNTPSWQQQAGIVLGDYYFSRARLGAGGQVSSGFRATSGMLLGQRSLALSTPALASGLTMIRQPRLALAAAEQGAEPWSAVPYLGVGWSGVSVRGGWGLSADVGVAGRTGQSGGLRISSHQSLDDLLRELRLTPMVQVGVSYAF